MTFTVLNLECAQSMNAPADVHHEAVINMVAMMAILHSIQVTYCDYSYSSFYKTVEV